MPSHEPLITEVEVAALARVARLTVPSGADAALVDTLDGLLTDADAVNGFMAGRDEVLPSVRFHHGEREAEA